MDIFIVIRVGVYRHEIGGVFTTPTRAFNEAKRLLMSEPDMHHNYEVLLQRLDTPSYIGETRADSGSFQDGKLIASLRWSSWLPHHPVGREDEIVVEYGGEATR